MNDYRDVKWFALVGVILTPLLAFTQTLIGRYPGSQLTVAAILGPIIWGGTWIGLSYLFIKVEGTDQPPALSTRTPFFESSDAETEEIEC